MQPTSYRKGRTCPRKSASYGHGSEIRYRHEDMIGREYKQRVSGLHTKLLQPASYALHPWDELFRGEGDGGICCVDP